MNQNGVKMGNIYLTSFFQFYLQFKHGIENSCYFFDHNFKSFFLNLERQDFEHPITMFEKLLFTKYKQNI